jgi:N5-(cytidine 5'-diphosphoramidyl)-L-glutamine hydrolase
MKRIGITQRRDAVSDRNEIRDELDVEWGMMLWKLGIIAIPLHSGIVELSSYLDQLALDGFILSGGNDLGGSPERDRLEAGVLDYAKIINLPVLGVCRGMQFINYHLGGSLVSVQNHVATRHTLYGDLAQDYKGQLVNSYHNQAIKSENLSDDLIAIAYSEDQVIEAVKHKTYPWIGIMWHPERENPMVHQDEIFIKQVFGLRGDV